MSYLPVVAPHYHITSVQVSMCLLRGLKVTLTMYIGIVATDLDLKHYLHAMANIACRWTALNNNIT